MKTYKPEPGRKEFFEGMKFELKDCVYEVENITTHMVTSIMNALDVIASENKTPEESEKAVNDAVKSLIGNKEFEKNKPYSLFEVTDLFRWIVEEIYVPFVEATRADNGKDEEDVKK